MKFTTGPRTSVILVALASCVLACIATAQPGGQATNDAWQIVHGPLLLSSVDSSPVAVVGVTGDLEIGGVGWPQIRQDKGPTPLIITFGWYLRAGIEPDRISQVGNVIHHGQGSPVAIRGLEPGTRFDVDALIVGYDEVRRILARSKVPPGRVFVGIAVDEVQYLDGSRWVRGPEAG